MDNNKKIQAVSRNNNPLRSSSEQWLQYFKQAKIDLEEINKALLNNVETVDNENIKLKEAIRELISDLQEKEVSLDQSQKIIMKLKEEYTKLITEYQNIETSNQKYETEIANIKKQFENSQKSYSSYDKLIKQNENLKTENEILKKDNSNLKNLLSNKSMEYNKKEKECNDKEILLNDIKAKNENWINMIKEREKLIQDYSKRIEELNETIVNKDNQLKVMVNFSKSINNENKTNVKELTKQAVQTIKLFYNTLNLHNNNDGSIEPNQSNSNYIDILYKEDDKYFDNILNDKKENIEKKISTKLKDGLACVMYIPNTVKSIAKEFLIDMNFKNDLMKYELFSSYLREFQIVAFLKSIFSKVSIDKETKSSMSFDDICAKVILLKKGYEDLLEENSSLKKEIIILKQKNEELNLYIDKTKKDSKSVINKIKEKVNLIEKGYIDKIDELKSTIQRIKVKNNKDSQVLKNEIELTRNKLSKMNSYHTYEISRKDVQVLSISHVIEFSYKASNKSSNSSSRNIEIRSLPNANNPQVCLTFQPQFESSRANTSGNNNLSFQLNDSFNEKNYRLKKIENEHLKDEIARLKNEIGTLLLEMNSQREKPVQCKKCNDVISFITKDMSFESFMKILNFYMNLSCEIQKISNNTNEIFNQITKAEDKLYSSDKSDKKLKLSQIHSLFIEIQKLFSLITNSLNKFSKYNITFSSELQKLFALISQYIYGKPLPLQKITQMEYNIINISDLNKKVFSSSEYNKIYSIYQSISIEDIIPTFISKSNEISQLILNFNIDCDSELSATDREDNNLLLDLSTELALSNSSYKVVSNEIKKLKRRDIENKVICEIVKHYLIALELICIKSNYNIDMINQIYKIYEELTMYKIDDIEDDGIFIRKTYLKCFLLLKWQIVPLSTNI